MSGATGEEGRLAVLCVARRGGLSRTRGSRRKIWLTAIHAALQDGLIATERIYGGRVSDDGDGAFSSCESASRG